MKPINLRERAKIILFSSKIILMGAYLPLMLLDYPVAWLLLICSLVATILVGKLFASEKTEEISFLFKCNEKQLINIEKWKGDSEIKSFVDNCISENGYLDGFNYKIAQSMQL